MTERNRETFMFETFSLKIQSGHSKLDHFNDELL